MKYLNVCLVILLALTGCSGPRQGRHAVRDRDEPQPLRILVDAGHGGQDFGTYSTKAPVIHEKDLTLATALMLRDHLQKLGYEVELTRKKDVFIPLLQRVDIAHKKEADLFVSVHYNSAPSAEAHGVEVFYFDSKADPRRSGASKQLATSVLGSLTSATHQKARGVKSGNFAVIRETQMPSILVEAGFLTNEGEVGRLRNSRYLNRIAWGIAEGVDAYLKGP